MDRGAWQAWNCKTVRHDLESEQQQPGRNTDSPESSREGPAARTALLPGLPAGAPPASVKKSRCIRRCVRAQTADTRAFLMLTLILKRQSVSRAPDCVQH